MPDLNRDHVSSVWRAGPQPRSCEFRVARRTSTAKWSERRMSERLSEDMSERMSEDVSEKMSDRMQKICQKECQKECQTECQKECQKIQKESEAHVNKMSERMSEYEKVCLSESMGITRSKVKVTGSSAGNRMYVSQPSPSQLFCSVIL